LILKKSLLTASFNEKYLIDKKVGTIITLGEEPQWLRGLIERILGVLNSLVDPQWVRIRVPANDKLIINSLIRWYMA
jgi:hypothetical protein